ncbi:hypothetical protein [Paenibacillus sp. tmac-D7]|uniref:hypothetical protein n=1 Tax=Paenibacillus sp. tmac-D7 TaxID=2591462 RepID=UPI0015E831A5|nr:hypothetical protein [Paenibacillus sp. tmac-D7]
MVVTTGVLMYEISMVTLLIFMIGNAFFNPPIRNSYTSHMYLLMSSLPNNGKKLKTELIVTRQIFLSIGRIVPIVFFMLFADGMDYHLVAWISMITAVTQLVLYYGIVQKNVKL